VEAVNEPEQHEPHNDLVRRSFGRQVEVFSKPDSPFAARADATSWLGALAPDLVVLEVACGAAHLAESTAPHVGQVVAIDLTPELLALAADRLRGAGIGNVLLQQGDAEALPFVDDSFDLVYCRASLHHMLNPSRAAAEMVRVCRPGGRVVISDLIAPSPDLRHAFDQTHRLLDPSHVRAFLDDELAHVFPEGVTVTAAPGTTSRLPVTIAVTPLSEPDLVMDRLRHEMAGGPPTGFEPAADDGTVVVSFTTTVVQATVEPLS
jgi:ubiquinone/menaquinone biosynthesis C-methylase UbiE